MDESINYNQGIDLLNLDNNNQTGFLQSTLGKVVNFAVDTGIRAVLPDIIEDEIINIKDTMMEQGFSEGISEAIKSATDIGKSALGIFTGNFENISQAKKAFEKGGLIDGVSNVLDYTLDKVNNLNVVPDYIINIVKEGKDILLKNVSSEIKKEFSSQTKHIENLEKYTKDWKNAYKDENLEQMEKTIKKVKNTLKKIMPIETLITEAKEIENIHNLIKNNGGNFNLSNEELELTKLLR